MSINTLVSPNNSIRKIIIPFHETLPDDPFQMMRQGDETQDISHCIEKD